MYEGFYGLSRPPFAVTPDPAMLFMSRTHREALATIIYGVETRKGFLVCTGEVGTGKSTIIRAFFDQIPAEAAKLIYIFTPQVTPFEIARYICTELGMQDPESVFAAVPRLQLKLLEEFESGRTVVLMIDEAQLLPPETLEFLRLLSNFETDTEKLIQIVLVGQPEVDATLARRDMRQVNQRVALRARLEPFSIEESFEYIRHRLLVSGAEDIEQVMSPSAAWLIAEASGGIPRVVNILADNALIAGFGAAQRPLGSHLAGLAVREFQGKATAPPPEKAARRGIGWRAAMRLRSALIREKSEPVAWVAAPPPQIGTRPPRQAAVPRSVPLTNSAAPQPEIQAPPTVKGAAEAPLFDIAVIEPEAPAEIAMVEPNEAWEPEAALIEPLFFDPDATTVEPVTMVEPVLPPGPPRFPLRANGAAPVRAPKLPDPARSPREPIFVEPSIEWPALSRVRSGLHRGGSVDCPD